MNNKKFINYRILSIKLGCNEDQIYLLTKIAGQLTKSAILRNGMNHLVYYIAVK